MNKSRVLRRPLARAVVTAICALFIAVGARGESILFVAPDGSDSFSGTVATTNSQRTDGPLTSPARAIALAVSLARAAHQPVDIRLQSGTYFLQQPLVITADAGNDQPLTIEGEPGASVVLSGGRRLGPWSTATLNNRQCWCAELPSDLPTLHELWVNGIPAVRARHPAQGYLIVGTAIRTPHGKPGETVILSKPQDMTPADLDADTEAIVTNRWYESRSRITSLDLCQWWRNDEEKHRSFTFEHNILYGEPMLFAHSTPGGLRCDENLYWHIGGDESGIRFGPMTAATRPKQDAESTIAPPLDLRQWQAAGQDRHSIIADPGFADPAKGDFTMRADSPARQIGFVPFDPQQAGPRAER